MSHLCNIKTPPKKDYCLCLQNLSQPVTTVLLVSTQAWRSHWEIPHTYPSQRLGIYLTTHWNSPRLSVRHRSLANLRVLVKEHKSQIFGLNKVFKRLKLNCELIKSSVWGQTRSFAAGKTCGWNQSKAWADFLCSWWKEELVWCVFLLLLPPP